ncbi:MAG: hypothetical protein Q8L48_39355 [Archangium sp.]|nr:hypothetical protein [Archangium sp.]
MRWTLLLMLALVALGCGPTGRKQCATLQLGQAAFGLPREEFFPDGEFQFGLSSVSAPNGPVRQHLCCARRYGWCTGEDLQQCSEPAFQNVELVQLGEPYSGYWDYDADLCFVAVKEGAVVATWMRIYY